jgi:hypothetical protein
VRHIDHCLRQLGLFRRIHFLAVGERWARGERFVIGESELHGARKVDAGLVHPG